MNSLAIKARTALGLGLTNIVRVAIYKLGILSGLSLIRNLRATVPSGPFFTLPPSNHIPKNVTLSSNWSEKAEYFGWSHFSLNGQCPDWHKNPFSGKRVPEPDRQWWEIGDFDSRVGDIKTIWEASRFDWVLIFAQHIASGDGTALTKLDNWLAHWLANNPPYCGPNWKCGQEASIRVMHLAMAALICEQAKTPCSGLLQLIEVHLKRISPTLSYAIAQDNNHGTSEAAALFIGGTWLAQKGCKKARRWACSGRYWLENRAKRLIQADGSFSQHSVNYHRMMLDTFSIVEIWRLHRKVQKFSATLYTRLSAATHWMNVFTDSNSGDAPNLGANDGAHLLPLVDSDYRDFRPSVQLAMILFNQKRAYEKDGSWNAPLQWLNIHLPEDVAEKPGTRLFDDGGYAVLLRRSTKAILRYPRFCFRPSQADALHVDFWFAGKNHLRDGGTYSYNTDNYWIDYFAGTASHNTVQFDDRDQMPRLSRFLFGDWLHTQTLEPPCEIGDNTTCAAAYCDSFGAKHHRQLSLGNQCLYVEDQVNGFQKKAILRWRLRADIQWKIDGNCVTGDDCTLFVTANVPIIRFDLVEGWESRYYLQRTKLPVLEVEIKEPGTFKTKYSYR